MEAIGDFDHADSEGLLRVLAVSRRALAGAADKSRDNGGWFPDDKIAASRPTRWCVHFIGSLPCLWMPSRMSMGGGWSRIFGVQHKMR